MNSESQVAFIIEESVNPSSDFFVVPELQRRGYEIRRFGFNFFPKPEELSGKVLVFVRYVPKNWKLFVDRFGAKIQQLIYFMDDDLFRFSSLSGLPLRYQVKLIRYALFSQSWLKKYNVEYWVSTPYLQSAYQSLKPELILPKPMKQTNKPVTVFYHGSASHNAELRWLLPVIEDVLCARNDIIFEVIGNAEVRKLVRGISRVNLLQPMKWVSYQGLIARGGRDIGLAPLLDNPFNRARSYTKFFDITASKSVGVYANNEVYTSVVKHEYNGMLASMEHSEWINMILMLIDDVDKRRNLLTAAMTDYNLLL